MDIKHLCPNCGFKIDRPNQLPKRIIRMTDGMEFLLNEKTQRYRVHLGIPHLDDPEQLHHEYEYERLMDDSGCQGTFKVADGTEDIAAMKKAWFERVSKNRHFDEDDE